VTPAEGGPTVVVAVTAGALALVLFAAVLLHAVHAGVRTRRDRARLDELHDLLGDALDWTDAGSGAAVRPTVRTLPSRLWVTLLEEADPALDGVRRERLARLMRQLGVTGRAERWCASRRWPRRLRGLRILTVLRDGHTTAAALLHDHHPHVRALAMEWAARNPSEKLVGQLVRRLSTPRGESLFPVKDALVRMGDPAVEALARFVARQDGAALEAALEVAVAVGDPRLLAPALAASGSSAPRVRALAATLAGALGGDTAADRLTQLLSDPDPEVRTAAVGGLAKLDYWPAASQVAALLRDPAWPVRNEAGLALRAFGATGTLLLRRALDEPDRYARDMARHVLDLPRGHQVEVPA
jgi:HEAT repeat protein